MQLGFCGWNCQTPRVPLVGLQTLFCTLKLVCVMHVKLKCHSNVVESSGRGGCHLRKCSFWVDRFVVEHKKRPQQKNAEKSPCAVKPMHITVTLPPELCQVPQPTCKCQRFPAECGNCARLCQRPTPRHIAPTMNVTDICSILPVHGGPSLCKPVPAHNQGSCTVSAPCFCSNELLQLAYADDQASR